MPRHHFLPASYLALFSNDKVTLPSRERRLVVGDRNKGNIFSSAAANIGCINNLYTLQNNENNSQIVDQIWFEYEKELPTAVEQLIQATISAETWTRILIPFVACLFLRGPDFNNRFSRRLNALGLEHNDYSVSPDNINNARLIELQRLLAPVTAAKWAVLRFKKNNTLITNDLGYAVFLNPSTKDFGAVIPLGLNHALTISPQTKRTILRIKNGKWIPQIEYYENIDDFVGFNTAIASTAQRFIYGADDATVKQYLSAKTPPPPLEPIQLGFVDGHLARAYEFTWHRLVGVLKLPPTDRKTWEFPLDLEAVSSGWHPFIVLPINLIEFPSALKRSKNTIQIEFYDPEVYYSISVVLNLEQMGDYRAVVDEATKVLPLVRENKYRYRLLLAKAGALAELGNIEPALIDFNLAIALDPDNPTAYVDKGYALVKAKRKEEAIDLFTTAITLDSACGVAYLNRGSCLADIGNLDKAINDFNLALDLLSDNSAKANAFCMRGNVYFIKENNQEAILDFTHAIPLYTDLTAKAQCLYKRAVAKGACNQIEDSIDDLTEAITNDPDFFDALFLRARLYMQSNYYEKALQDLEKAFLLTLNSNDKADIFRLRAICYSDQMLFEEANSLFDSALELGGENQGSILYDKGISLLYQGWLDQAINAFEHSLQLFPNNSKALNNLGICKMLQNKYHEALLNFDKSLSSCPESADKASIYRNKAITLAKIENYDGAKVSLNSIEVAQTESFLTLIARGRFYWFQSDYNKSLETHLQAQSVASLDYAEYVNPFTALAMLSVGQEKDALLVLQKWLDLNPFPLERLIFKSDLDSFMQRFPISEETKKVFIRIGQT